MIDAKCKMVKEDILLV